MAEAAQAKGGGGSKLLWLLVLALIGVVWWLASERNARKYTLESHAGELVISKGRFFPTGAGAIGPGDGPLGKTYAGIALPAGLKPIPETEFEDQTALDRALFDLLSGWARAAMQKREQAGYQLADELVTRVTALPGLTPAQLGELQNLRAELGWWSVGSDLGNALKALAAARHKLEDVRRGDVEHAAQAAQLLAPLDALAGQLTELAAGRTEKAAPGALPAAGVPALAAPGATAPPPPAAADGGTAAPAVAAAPADAGVAAAAGAAVPAAAAPPAVPGAAPDAGALAEPPPPARPHGRASAPGSVSSGAPRGDAGKAP